MLVVGKLELDISTRMALNLYLSPVRGGFPSPADDYIDRRLDFNERFIDSPSSTFWLRVIGDSMNGAGIMPGTYLLVDRAKTPKHRSIVVATVDGEHLVKRLVMNGNGTFLCSENASYQPIPVDERIEIIAVCIAAVIEFI